MAESCLQHHINQNWYYCYLPNALAALDRSQNPFVCVSVSEDIIQNELNDLYRSSSTHLHQTCHHGSVPGDVITYCFWWKYGILTSIKPEVELIFTIALMEKCV